MGESAISIAQTLNLSVGGVRLILKSTLAQEELARMRAVANEKVLDVPFRIRRIHELNAAAEDSLRLNHNVVNDGSVDMRTRTRVASHFLDKIAFSDINDEKEGSFRDILRSLATIEKQIASGATSVLLPTRSINGHGDLQ